MSRIKGMGSIKYIGFPFAKFKFVATELALLSRQPDDLGTARSPSRDVGVKVH